jgi:hypothetical protein
MKRDRIAERLAHYRDTIKDQKSQPALDYFHLSHLEMFCQVMAAPSPVLSRAAEFFDLDVKDELQRATLLTILADVVFGEAPKGRPKKHSRKWSRFRLVRLAVDLEKIKGGLPNLSDRKATALLKKKFPKRYKHNSAEIIRQNASEARGWLDNARRIRADREG